MNHLRQNQLAVYKTALAAGLSTQAAKVIAANFSGESLAQPNDRHWDVSHYSQGVAQWSQDRAERIKAHFNKYPKDMTVEEQTEAFIWECQKHYPKTWAALIDKNLSPHRQMEILIRDFERPRDPLSAAKGRMKHYASLKGVEDGEPGQGTA